METPREYGNENETKITSAGNLVKHTMCAKWREK